MGRDDEETVAFEECEAIIETDAALFIHQASDEDDGFNEPGKADQSDGRWVPKSVIHDDSEVYKKGGDGKLVVKEWWARKNGLT